LDESRPWPQPPAGLDWEKLLSLLARHRLSGPFHALGKSDAEWPGEFRERLRLERYRWMLHGERSRTRVHSVLAALRSAHVDVIVLKGWAYIYSLYDGDVSQRLCEDVDLLIRPRDVDTVEQALLDLGCMPNPPTWPGYARRYENGEIFFFASLADLPTDAFSIGLHWGLFHIPSYNPLRVDVDALLARADPLDVAGVPSLELSSVDSLVYACGHLGLHHRVDPALFRYYDIASLLAKAGAAMDWDVLARRAVEWDVLLPLRNVLQDVDQFWPGLLPAAALDAIARLSASRRERFVDAWLRWTGGRAVFNHLLLWFTFPDWRQRPWIALQSIFPGPAYLTLRYGRAPFGAWPLLYIRRLARAVGLFFGREEGRGPL
jgi:hypothetical protein